MSFEDENNRSQYRTRPYFEVRRKPRPHDPQAVRQADVVRHQGNGSRVYIQYLNLTTDDADCAGSSELLRDAGISPPPQAKTPPRDSGNRTDRKARRSSEEHPRTKHSSLHDHRRELSRDGNQRVDDFTAESVSGSEAPPEYQRASLVSQAIFLQEQLAKAHSRIQQLEYFKNLRMPKKELCELAQLVEAEAHLQEVENAIKEREETIKTYYLKEQQMKKALLAKRQTAHQLATHSPLYITLENEADQLTWMGKCMQAFSDAHKAKKPPQPDDASQR